MSTAGSSKSARHSSGVTVTPFGELPDGHKVDMYVITTDAIELRALTLGGIITSLRVGDARRGTAEVVLGHDQLAPYVRNTAYFGAVVGRYANRIAAGRFRLDGVSYQLATNDGGNHLH